MVQRLLSKVVIRVQAAVIEVQVNLAVCAPSLGVG